MPDDRPDETPTTESPSPAPPARRFLRSRDERLVGGVAGGLAKSLGVDVWIVRLVFVAASALGGAGVIAYLVALAFVPEDRGDGIPVETPPLTGARALKAVALVGAGVLALAVLDGGFGIGWLLGPNLLGAALLAGIAYAAYRALERGGDRPAAARITAAVLLVVAVLCVVAVGMIGAFWIAATGGGTAAAATVIVLGAVAVVSAFVRPVRWLAPAALVVALPVAVVAAADIDIDGGIGERTYRPADVSEVRDHYRLGMGELVVDLRELEWPRDGVLRTRVAMGIGHVQVLVPRGVCVTARGDIGVGALSVMDEESGGVDVAHELRTGTRADRPRLIVDGDLGIGHLEVDTRRYGPGPFAGGREAPLLLQPGGRRGATEDCAGA